MPGRKFTMLPEDVIAAYSLDEGATRPALSFYFDVAEEGGELRGRSSRIERVRVAANLRHATYDVLNEALPAGETRGLAFEDELRALWRVACSLEARRGKSSAPSALDYSFHVEGERVRIVPRKRGSPLDKLVSELMI